MKIKDGVLLNVTNEDIKNGTFTLPDGVTSIGDYAFYGFTNLKNLTISDSVKSIGNYAFKYCESLEHLTIPDGVTSIGNYAFNSCTNLKNLTISDSVKSIGNSAFAYCESLEHLTILNGVTRIGDCAFDGCTSLQDITIPDSVTSIGRYAFYGCSNLKNITIPDSVTSIGDCAFCNCTSLKSEERVYKGFNCHLVCDKYGGYYQYELGKLSDEIEDIMICEKGYHYCTNLFDIFNYYYGRYGKDFVICECEVGDKVLTHNEDSKCCTNKIKPVKKLEWNEVLNILNGGDRNDYKRT